MSTLITEKQASFIASLAARKQYPLPEGIEAYTRQAASELIDMLMSLSAPAPKELEDGVYMQDGHVFKVQHAVHGSGRQYAKVLNPHTAEWTFAKGMVYKIKPENILTLDQAKEFGLLYGVCAICGRTLTDEKSIEAGIGPVCAGKF